MTLLEPVQWPGDFSTEMVLSYWQGATPPPPGASIEPVLMSAPQPTDEADPA